MITRGSKIFFTMALAAFAAALAYGVVTNGLASGGVTDALSGDGALNALIGPITLGWKGGVGDHLGYAVLMGFAVCCAAAGFVTTAFRDGDPEAIAELADAADAPPIAAATELTPWPLVAAFGAAILTLGLATSSTLFIVGVVISVIALLEWTITAWADAATGDPEVNRIIRSRLMHPIELPVAGVAGVGIVAFSISRIFLTASKNGAVIVAAILGLTFLVVAVILSKAPELKRGLVVGVILAGGLLVIGLGVASAIRGERKVEHHEADAEHASVDSAGALSVGETSS